MIRISKHVLAERLGVEWTDTPLERALAYLPNPRPDGPWLAGGAIRRTINQEPLDSDFDFFFKDQQQFKVFDSILGEYRSVSNDKNTTYYLPPKKMDEKVWRPEMRVQAINFKLYDSIEAVLDSFDFTITQFGFDGSVIVASDFALWDLARKRLVVNKVTYGTATVRRLLKYSKQGFTACSGCLSTILEEVAAKPSVIEPEVKYLD